jgi:transitional endoplasmic reticulum ATPase
MTDYYIPPRVVGRVRMIDEDGHVLYLGLSNGSVSVLASEDEIYEYPIDTVVLFDPETQQIDEVPKELWEEPTWIGVVRQSGDGKAVVERDPSLFQVEAGDIADLRAGNTVEIDPRAGIKRIISERPLESRLQDATSGDSVAAYRTEPADQALTFDDFGGLPGVKRRARELIETPLEHHALLAEIGARPIKGVLFTGGPGTGKTMLARIVASQSEATFYEISGPQIFNKWYGQSEKVIRDIFADARTQERAIVFFDEIDSVAGRRSEDTHEASRRVVAQLLTEMDSFRPDANIIVIATTNRPQDIDPALRRPGRFDWEIDFPTPNESDRAEILRTSAQRLRVSSDLEHSQMAQGTVGWSAAELSAIFSEAALLAVSEARNEILYDDYWGGFERVNRQRSRDVGLDRADIR